MLCIGFVFGKSVAPQLWHSNERYQVLDDKGHHHHACLSNIARSDLKLMHLHYYTIWAMYRDSDGNHKSHRSEKATLEPYIRKFISHTQTLYID